MIAVQRGHERVAMARAFRMAGISLCHTIARIRRTYTLDSKQALDRFRYVAGHRQKSWLFRAMSAAKIDLDRGHTLPMF